MRITICHRRQVGFLFFVFAARQQVPPLKNNNQTGIIRKLWWSVSRSWWRSVSGSWCHSKAGGIRRLVASGGWLHPEAGGIQRLVASGGWWRWECRHYHGWVDFFHFLHLEACGLPTPPPPGWIFIFCFRGKPTGATVFFNNQTGITRKLWWSVSRSWWQFPEAGGIRRLVASGGWWHPEAGGGGNATTTMAGLTFFIFCNQKSVPLQFNLSQGELFPFFMK